MALTTLGLNGLTLGTAGQVPQVNASATGWQYVGLPVTLLKSGSGSTTNASAENVDTLAISGLTILDTLLIHVSIDSVAQATASPQLYNSTDSLRLCLLRYDGGAGSLAAGTGLASGATLRNWKSSLKKVTSLGLSHPNLSETLTFTTDWTGNWTLALRHLGVTAGGTFYWSWAVYKLAGQ